MQNDGRIIVSGDFTQVNGVATKRIVRLNPDGSTDLSFDAVSAAAALGGDAGSISLQSNGKILLAGTAGTYYTKTIPGLIRLNSDGSTDPSFSVSATNGTSTAAIGAVAVQADDKILIFGAFSQINGTARNGAARLNADGTLDKTFDPAANGSIYTGLLLASGKLLVSGEFTQIGGSALSRIARLNADGSADATFQSASFFSPHLLAPGPDGSVVIGDRSGMELFRLNADGSFSAFHATTNAAIDAVVVQADNKILVGGPFDLVNGRVQPNPTPSNSVVRLEVSGIADASYLPDAQSGPNMAVSFLAVQPNGKVVIAGDFTAYNGYTHNHLARLNSNASLDPDFTAGVTGTDIDYGSPQVPTLAFGAQRDGKILTAACFDYYFPGSLNRLNADGSPDTDFKRGLSIFSIPRTASVSKRTARSWWESTR